MAESTHCINFPFSCLYQRHQSPKQVLVRDWLIVSSPPFTARFPLWYPFLVRCMEWKCTRLLYAHCPIRQIIFDKKYLCVNNCYQYKTTTAILCRHMFLEHVLPPSQQMKIDVERKW